MFKLSLLVGLLGGIASAIPTSTWPASFYQQAQDPSGAYRYGYSSPHHDKMESRANGITQGGYSYIDANGILQKVAYTADDVNGFGIRASNLPRPIENPLIQNDGDVHGKTLADYDKIENRINVEDDESGNPFLLSPGQPAAIKIPRPYLSINAKDSGGTIVNYQGNHLPLTLPTAYVPIVPLRLMHSSLHHMQDSLGQYDYSYAGDTSAKTESRSLDGTTRGAYSYIDANGLLQQVHYIADHNGFRVLATNLPQA